MTEYWFSYSGYKTYRGCPQRYRFSRVDKLEPPVPDSKHNALVGSVVQRVFEDFYNEEIWREGKKTSQTLLELVPKHFYEYLDAQFIDWKSPSCRKGPLELLEECKAMIVPVLSGIIREGLLGPFARSEVKMRAQLTENYFLYGQVDFLIRQVSNSILLLDGKASKKREKYVDEEQLAFYALAFKLIHDRLPDRLGFYFYSFADDPDAAFDWIVPDEPLIKKMEEDLLVAFTNLQEQKFKATPGPECKWCPWENVCRARQEALVITREKQRWARAERGEETLPSMKDTEDAAGSQFVGFGGIVTSE